MKKLLPHFYIAVSIFLCTIILGVVINHVFYSFGLYYRDNVYDPMPCTMIYMTAVIAVCTFFIVYNLKNK